MFGVPINWSTNIFCDNGTVCVKTTRPESTLSKKNNSIAYHHAQEAGETGTTRVSKEHASTNLADLLTNTMTEPKREGLLENFTYWKANWSMWFFYPRDGLPQEIDLFVSERTKLKCYSEKSWYLTEGTKLIWKTWDNNGSQVPCVTRSHNNGMIQPLWLCSKATEWLSEFVVTL